MMTPRCHSAQLPDTHIQDKLLPDGSNVTSSQNYSSEGDQSGQQ